MVRGVAGGVNTVVAREFAVYCSAMDSGHFDRERERLAQHYANLENEELLKIAREPWSLSDAAWETLEDEFDRRGLEIPTPETLPQTAIPEKRELVLLRRFRDLPEALLARGKLVAAGVDAILADDNIIRMDWLWSNLVGGLKIFVSPDDFAEASQLLNEPIPEKLEVEGEAPYEQPRCPVCQSLDINFEELHQQIAYASLCIFPLPIQRKGWFCHSCGHSWEYDATTDEPSAPPSQTLPE